MNNSNQYLAEPLTFLYKKYGIDFGEIEKLVSGDQYSAVLLKNKSLGVCANIDKPINTDLSVYQVIDLEKIQDRIFLNAYYNAKFNNNETFKGKDLFEIINIKFYEKVVVIGNFFPIVAKFKRLNIKYNIFDLKENFDYLTSMSKQMDFLQKADCVILTATTIFNKTFMDICANTKNNCHIFLLGPSTPMTLEMFNYRNIKHLFGTSFQSEDSRVLDLIEKNKGPREFLKYGDKTMILEKL